MKNLMLLGLVLLALYLYLHPKTEIPPEVVTPVVAQATPPPRLYYHSPLDASALPTNVSTGTGYYSTDPSTSRFNARSAVGGHSSSAAFGGYPVYYGSNSTTIYNNQSSSSSAPASRQQPQAASSAYVAGRVPTYPNNSSQRTTTANQ